MTRGVSAPVPGGWIDWTVYQTILRDPAINAAAK